MNVRSSLFEVVAECLTCSTPGGKVWVWDVAESLFCVLGQDTVPLFTQGQGELSGKLTKFCRGGGWRWTNVIQ